MEFEIQETKEVCSLGIIKKYIGWMNEGQTITIKRIK
jgi:hypothetical protein